MVGYLFKKLHLSMILKRGEWEQFDLKTPLGLATKFPSRFPAIYQKYIHILWVKKIAERPKELWGYNLLGAQNSKKNRGALHTWWAKVEQLK
jgi:hypothetical protein